MDFLSVCPSLVDIFQIVDYEDILNCHLVNRSFYDIIHNNPKSMPRRNIMHLTSTHKEETTATPYIVTGGTCLVALITSERIVLYEKKRPMFVHYGLHGREGELVSELTEADTTMKVIRDNFKNPMLEEYIGRMEIYKNDGMTDGLRTIWYRNYSCITMEIGNSMPEEWMDVLSECGEGILPRTLDLTVPVISPALQRLVKSLRCPELLITSNDKETFQSDVQVITSWNIGIKVERLLDEVDALQEFTLLLQNWCSGVWSLDKVNLHSHQDPEEGPFPWNSESVNEMIAILKDNDIEINNLFTEK